MELKRMTVEELLRRYAAGERNFTGIEVVRASVFIELDGYFEGVDLSGASFRDGNLHGIARWMQEINLSRSDLSGLDLAYAHLERAYLSGANLSNVCLWRASLERANLSGANLSGSDLQETGFLRTNLSGCNFTGANIREIYFGRANLTDADFRNCQTLWRVSFAKANLTRTNFFGVDICEIERAISDDAYFKDTIFPDGTILSSDG